MAITLTQSYQKLNEKDYYASGIRSKLAIYGKYNKYSSTENQDITNNKDSVTFQLRTSTYGGSFYSSGNSAGLDCAGNRGTQYYDIGTVNTSEKVIGTWTFDIKHKDDGTYSGSAVAWADVFAGVVPSISCEFSLPTIPRVSDISCTSPFVGDTAAIIIGRKASIYRDTISYKIGTLTGILATKTEETTIPFETSEIADVIYEEMGPKNTSIKGTMTIETFNNNTSIGKKEITFTLYAKESDCIPEITVTIVDINEETKALTTDNNMIVKGYSNVQVTYEIETKNGATLSSRTINGINLGTSPFIIEKAETNIFTITVADSRGFSNTIIIAKQLIGYIPLTLSFNAFRPSPTGSEIDINFVGNFYNGDFGPVTSNNLSLCWKYRQKGDDEWLEGNTFVLDTDYKISENSFYSGTGQSASNITLSDSLFPYDKVYEIGIFYEDKLLSYSATKVVPKGKPVINWKEEEVHINVPAYLQNGSEILETIVVNESYETFKYENNKCLDSTAIKHDNQLLSTILKKMLEKKRIYTYTSSDLKQSVAANDWNPIMEDITTEKIPAGTYLIIYAGTLGGSGDIGLTLNPVLDFERLGIETRQSISITAGLIFSAQCSHIVKFDYEQEHTLNICCWSTKQVDPKAANVIFIRID